MQRNRRRDERRPRRHQLPGRASKATSRCGGSQETAGGSTRRGDRLAATQASHAEQRRAALRLNQCNALPERWILMKHRREPGSSAALRRIGAAKNGACGRAARSYQLADRHYGRSGRLLAAIADGSALGLASKSTSAGGMRPCFTTLGSGAGISSAPELMRNPACRARARQPMRAAAAAAAPGIASAQPPTAAGLANGRNPVGDRRQEEMADPRTARLDASGSAVGVRRLGQRRKRYRHAPKGLTWGRNLREAGR